MKDDIFLKGGRDFMYAANHIISVTRSEPNEELAVLPVQRCGKGQEVAFIETGEWLMDQISKKNFTTQEKVSIWTANNDKAQGE